MAHDQSRTYGDMTASLIDNMITFNRLFDMFVNTEGFDRYARSRDDGKLVIGVGRIISPGGQGVSRYEARRMWERDIKYCEADLVSAFPGWAKHPEHIRFAMLHLRYYLSQYQFRQETAVIEAIRNKDYAKAREAVLDTVICKNDPRRCEHISNIIFGVY